MLDRATMIEGSRPTDVGDDLSKQALASLVDATLDASDEGILVTSLEGTVRHVNDRFLEMWGIPDDLAETTDANDLLDRGVDRVEDPDRFLDQVQALYEAPEEEFTHRIDLEDGRVIERNSVPYRLEGEVVGRVSCFRDVTRDVDTQQRLERTRSLDRTILESTADGILAVDLEGDLVAYNDRFQEMWGIPDELIQQGDDDALLEHVVDQLESPEQFLAQVRALYDTPEAESFDTIRFEDGRVFERFSKPHHLDGEVVGRVWSFRDVTRHKRVQARLRRSEEELRDLFDNLPIGLYRTTPDGRALLVNDALVEMLGYDDAEEILTRDLEADDELFEPDYSRERFRRRLQDEDEIRGLEARWTLRDGTQRFVRESARTVRDDEGRVLYYEGTVEDVTDRVRAERELEASQRRLEAVLAEAPILLVSLAPDGTVTFVEGSGLGEFGLAPEDLEGGDAHELVMLNDQTREAIDRALDGKPAHSMMPIQDRWIQVQLVPISEQEELDGVIGVLVDVTDRKKVEEELRESRQFLETLVTQAPVILSMLDPDGRITYVTGSGLDALDVDPGDLIGTDAFEAFPDNEAHHANLRRALAGEQTTETLQIGDQWLQIESVPTFDEDGELESVIRVGMDVTARKQAEEQARRLNETLEQRVQERTAELEAANQELKAFSYSIGHDLRGPLQTIDGFSQIILEDAGDALGPQSTQLLERIRGASRTMDRRIDALLSLSRVTRKQLELEPVDLSQLAEGLVDDLRRKDPDRDVTVVIEPGLKTRADPELVELLLENLLRNAWKFTRDEATPRIEVASEPGEDGPVFVVRDNGIGFDPDQAERVFEPFHRLEREAFEGTGVGLASVERIVRRHGGTIEATGVPGEGATFRFRLAGRPPDG